MHTRTIAEASSTRNKTSSRTWKAHSSEEGRTTRYISRGKLIMGWRYFSTLWETTTNPWAAARPKSWTAVNSQGAVHRVKWTATTVHNQASTQRTWAIRSAWPKPAAVTTLATYQERSRPNPSSQRILRQTSQSRSRFLVEDRRSWWFMTWRLCRIRR